MPHAQSSTASSLMCAWLVGRSTSKFIVTLTVQHIIKCRASNNYACSAGKAIKAWQNNKAPNATQRKLTVILVVQKVACSWWQWLYDSWQLNRHWALQWNAVTCTHWCWEEPHTLQGNKVDRRAYDAALYFNVAVAIWNVGRLNRA